MNAGRLKSIRNIEKITKTMKIVASTKLTRAQKAMTESRTYGQTSNQVFEEAETKPLEEKKTLMVICSSDKGLCGGIHSGLSRATRRMLEGQTNVDIAIIGEKCKAQLSRSNAKQIVLSFAGIGKDVPTFGDAQAIADQICMLPEEYASVRILYNKFLNAQSYEPTPIEAFSEEAITQSPNFAAFEIDDEVTGNLREYALANSLFWALAEGHACEQSARRNAMDVSTRRARKILISLLIFMQNASKNAGDMISKFTILYNRTRQAVITGELVEIITVCSFIPSVLCSTNAGSGCHCFGRHVNTQLHINIKQSSFLVQQFHASCLPALDISYVRHVMFTISMRNGPLSKPTKMLVCCCSFTQHYRSVSMLSFLTVWCACCHALAHLNGQ